MLIDASHEEETRVAIIHGNRVEEFDYEASAKKQIKGNVYLAKVTRVEPSLQAAFVEYGGNRHGFLAFSEIHPDYYQIPVADREALIAQEAAANVDVLEEDIDILEDEKSEASSGTQNDENSDKKDTPEKADAAQKADSKEDDDDVAKAEDAGSSLSDEEEAEEKLRIRIAKRLRHKYKIQEVIKKNQVLLIQVVKEERGNKGAALTTYLSLPGRYCVLMPNTLHGGGVSRKIANVSDRKKLKKILADLNMPSGMACIIRTAGHSRTRTEIKRDFDYLNRMWEGIRTNTLKSIAPALIYEEGNLIKRSIRDLYTREIDEILVEGEKGYKTAKSFMRLLMPSHARKISHYEEKTPLFHRYQVEGQLDSMYNPSVQLKSGGYIVINPTEALVSIDVNSGKSTKEHNVEGTARKTNLEAAEEIARQLRLRDMAGLVVIDFIDMEERGNIRAVEHKMKDCLKGDRARIQIGRISSFGLMEMSRQRLRAGVLESSTHTCPHCEGAGVVRSIESQVLHVLRVLEEEAIRNRSEKVTIYLPSSVATYLFNNKRANLVSLETQYGANIDIAIDPELTETHYRLGLDGGGSKKPETQNSLKLGKPAPRAPEKKRRDHKRDDNRDEKRDSGHKSHADGKSGDEEQDKKPRRRRRRRGPRNRDENTSADAASEAKTADTQDKSQDENLEKTSDKKPDGEQAASPEKTEEGEARKPRRRRSRRRGPRASHEGENVPAAKEDTEHKAVEKQDRPAPSAEAEKSDNVQTEAKTDSDIKADKAEKPARGRRPRKRKEADTSDKGEKTEESSISSKESDSPKEEEKKPARTRRKPAAKKADDTADIKEADAEKKKPVRKRKTAEKKSAEPKAGKKTAEKSSEKSSEKAVEKSVEKAVEKPGSKAADKTASKPKEKALSSNVKVIEVGKADKKDAAPAPKKKGWWSL